MYCRVALAARIESYKEQTMKSIQTKFIALILGCVLLSSTVIGGVGIFTAKQVSDENSTKIMNLLCTEKARRIDTLLSRIEQSVDTLAAYAIGQITSAEVLQTDDVCLETYTENILSVAINAANNTEGALAVYLRFNPDFGNPVAGFFWGKKEVNGEFQEFMPTDLSEYSPDDVEHVGWYYQPVKSGKAIWMEPYQNQNINIEMISYVVPLYADDVTVGVIGMDIDLDAVRDMVRDVEVYSSGYAFLSDARANIVYHKEFPPGTSLAGLENGLPASKELMNAGENNRLVTYFMNGEKKKMALCSLRNGMWLGVTAPTAEIDAAKNRMILQSGLALVFFLIFSVFLTIFMTRRLIRPLKELNEAARKIAEGDLSIVVTHRTQDEVGMLADSFQLTVNHLQKYIHYINSLAYLDGMTGAKNKTAYQEAVAMLDKQASPEKMQYAVIVFDINDLKTVNDTQGHDSGDRLIINACRIICEVFKRGSVFRIGGDEFVAILDGPDCGHYREFLIQFQEAVEEYNRSESPGGQIFIATGVAVYNEETDTCFNDVFKLADEAMYRQKAYMKRKKKAESENPFPQG